MNRLAKCSVACILLVPGIAIAQSAQAIYKFVDENGRVTYANSPIKGGSRLELDPLTVMPSSPASTVAQAPASRTIPVAKVTSVRAPTYSMIPPLVQLAASPTVIAPAAAAIAPASATLPAITMAALDTGDKAQEQAQQRRADIRKRILQGELQAEEKSMDEARVALAEEQRRSGDLRAMRASFSATAVATNPQKPLISLEVRAEIERHFERVRNLQDEVSMHEGNIAALRQEMVAKQ